jgi:hypothetical protein
LVEDAYRLAAHSGGETLILEANHTFGAKHPWTAKELPDELKEVSNSTIEFIKNNQQ